MISLKTWTTTTYLFIGFCVAFCDDIRRRPNNEGMLCYDNLYLLINNALILFFINNRLCLLSKIWIGLNSYGVLNELYRAYSQDDCC